MFKLKLALIFFVPFFLATSSLAMDESETWPDDHNEKLIVAMNIDEDNSHVFIIRFWLEPREIEKARPIWRGVIEHVSSGRRFYLKSFDEVEKFIQSFLQEKGLIPPFQ